MAKIEKLKKPHYKDSGKIKNNIDTISNKMSVTNDDKELLFKAVSRINKLCEDNKTLNNELAEALNVSVGALSDYRNGKTLLPYSKIFNIAKYFNVTVDYLMGLTDTQNYQLHGINEYIGLSEEAINSLHELKTNFNQNDNANEDILTLFSLLIKEPLDLNWTMIGFDSYMHKLNELDTIVERYQDEDGLARKIIENAQSEANFAVYDNLEKLKVLCNKLKDEYNIYLSDKALFNSFSQENVE